MENKIMVAITKSNAGTKNEWTSEEYMFFNNLFKALIFIHKTIQEHKNNDNYCLDIVVHTDNGLYGEYNTYFQRNELYSV